MIGSGTLPWSAYGGNEGIVYTLPYTINVTSFTQWLGIYDSDGVTKSDLIHFGAAGTLSFYSNDTDGDLADVSPAYWSTIVGNWDGFTTVEDATGFAFYSTYIDTGGVPGDPYPHPAVEAYYYFNSGPVPEPSTFVLCAVGLLSLIGWRAWRTLTRKPFDNASCVRHDAQRHT